MKMSGNSELHQNPAIHGLNPGSKLSHSGMQVLQAAQSSDLPIVMNEEVYNGTLTPDQQCFVLVNEGSVDSSMQRLLTEQESAMGTEVTLQEKAAAMQMMQVEGAEVVPGEGRTVEVLHMDDGKTVEVVQMDGGKTLEVMHIEDASKHSEVIHVECRGGLELINKAETVSCPPPTSSAQPVLFAKQKGSRYMWAGPEQLSPMTVKQLGASLPSTVPASLSLRSITTVNPSIVLTTSKGGLVTGQEFSHLSCPMPYSPARKPQLMETGGLQTLSDTNIVFSDSKGILSSSVEELNNAIIISWPNVATEPENTVATQTGPFQSTGPSMNLFCCTFYADGSAQTQCDMPCLSDVSVGTDDSSGCTGQAKQTIYHFNQRNNQAVKVNGEERHLCDAKDPLYLGGNSQSQRRHSKKHNHDPDFNPLKAEQEHSGAGTCQNLVTRKKRGRKRKKRFPPQEEFEEDIELYVEEGDEYIVGIKKELPDIKVEKKDIKEEEERVANEEELTELAQEVLKTKGYGLRTKRRLKKLSDMHYLKERVVRKRRTDGAAGGGKTQEFSCQVCGQVFPTFSRLQRHAKDVHNSSDFAFPCDLCGVVFTRPHNLERHKDTKHGDGERRFACEHCGRRFGRQDVLSVHISMVHFKKTLLQDSSKKGLPVIGSNYVHCTSCEKFFSKEQKLKEHQQGDLTCHQCNLSFECKTSLRTHQYKHHPTACSECGKVCKNKQQMYFHRLSHAPKFKCKVCNKSFLWKSQYSVHMATHTGEKPMTCEICGRSFAHKLAVNKHKWQEHNDSNKKFKCSACGKRFVYKGKLQSHMRSHTGEKPFKCSLCPSTFSQRCNLTAHIRSIHGIYIQSIKSDGTTHTQLVKYKRAKKPSMVLSHTSPAAVQEEEAQATILPPASDDTAAASGIVDAGMVDAGIAAPGMVDAGMAVAGIGDAGIGGTELDEEVAAAEHHTHQQVTIPEQVHISESFETEAAVYQIVYAYPQ